MKRMDAWLTIALIACLTIMVAPVAVAQSSATKPGGAAKTPGKKINPLEVKRLDARLDEVRDSFLRDTTTLILSYENLGQYERAKTLLESLQKLDPRNEPIKAKLGELNAKIIETNEFEVELATEASWQPIGAVMKDRPLRIRVTGDYNLTVSLTSLGPDGLPTTNPAEDLVANVPLGAVMGVITPSGSAGGNQNDKPPRPFAVGASFDKPADRDGILHLKVNVPPGARCTGSLKVKVSGPDRPSP
jgi:hypothetical protein